MARPWIEFVQSQWLPWETGRLPHAHPDAEVRTLSVDDEDGSCSLLVRYERAATLRGTRSLAADEEFLVLSGELTLGEVRYPGMSYAYLPAGRAADGLAAAAGTVLLVFYSRAPLAGAERPVDPARVIERVNAFEVPYTGNFHPEFPAGAGRKWLRNDPVTGEQSWLLGTLPLRWAERAELHPVIEEMYLIAGEVHGNRGVMRPGAYFWRPAAQAHGPYGSMTGSLYFFRTKGGSLKTQYVDTGRPFRWWPEYDPVLPEGLRAMADSPPSGARCW
ncbi:MAG: DUF4437 domain-containing protein [Steroidobacteraceae bacterium]|nr:DUF4437 domain-containing protein [Steroidobacteraceae bacterium]